ncbi:helix-turn-helix domain-containing protein [Paenibacillus polymyxa]|uniref:helix-turn-helix domain-containing protein n=1 Tax=Paenibacillus polymyxa TaxID=1406 RepID=UPI0006931F5B|nr:helix-turn-helix domain-containing protein [Paenibacillus polymyxa]
MKHPKGLGSDFENLKQAAREIPEVAEYLDSFSVTIGDMVLARRIQLGYTQSLLANLAQTTQARISQIESGNGNVTSDILNRVFKALKLASLNPTFRDEEAATIS